MCVCRVVKLVSWSSGVISVGFTCLHTVLTKRFCAFCHCEKLGVPFKLCYLMVGENFHGRLAFGIKWTHFFLQTLCKTLTESAVKLQFLECSVFRG